jgi:hypothetical protein
VVGSSKYGDEPAGSGTTELVIYGSYECCDVLRSSLSVILLFVSNLFCFDSHFDMCQHCFI